MMKDFSLELKKQVALCEAEISAFLPKEEGLDHTVREAMNYSVSAGGKRLRPLLMRSAYRLFAPEDPVFSDLLSSFMAAMEMIHTFSLCHDDLPCMDGDQYRRGRESTWYHFGEAMGTLAGDALSLYAFQVVSARWQTLRAEISEGKESAADEDTQRTLEQLSVRFGQAVLRLSSCSGVDGMLGGQVVDVEKTGQPLTEEELSFIYRKKTGALIAGSLEIGGILAGASSEAIRKLHAIGEKVGVAFQIQDDILDETSTQGVLGKPIHSDAENHKTTYVTIHGLQHAAEEVARLSEEAIALLQELPAQDAPREFLEELIRYLIHRKK